MNPLHGTIKSTKQRPTEVQTRAASKLEVQHLKFLLDFTYLKLLLGNNEYLTRYLILKKEVDHPH